MQKISDNVYVETSFHGCNTGFVVTREGVVVIDTPTIPSEARRWRQEIDKFGPVRYVINTEPHIDHVSGNSYFGGVVVAHEGTREAILSISIEQLKEMLQRMDALPLEEGFTYRPPDITFSQQLTIYLGEHTFRLINMPGHTPFQVAIHIPEERMLFTSDNVTRMLPYFRQALPNEWLDSLRKLQQLDFDKMVPGHGDVCDKNYLSEMNNIIRAWIEEVSNAISSGMSLEETLEKVTFIERYPMLATDDAMIQVRRTNVARLYEVLKK